MKIKSGTEDQESPIQWIPKAKACVGMLNMQNVLYISQSQLGKHIFWKLFLPE